MPRSARKKDPKAVYHTMCRSISEFDLFQCDDDKEYFLHLLLRYKEKYHCKIYGYCLMSNHYHLHIDTCGFDVSKFMQSLNLAYVRYINLKYKRRGPLFADRFNSKIIDTDQYNLTVSAYIHNNPKDLPDFAGKEEDYPYSSMGIYLGERKDIRGLIDTEFILKSINQTDKSKAIKGYAEMAFQMRDIGINSKLKSYLDEFNKEQYTYKSYREVILRNKQPEDVIKFIANKLGITNTKEIMNRWKRSAMEFRSVVSYVLNAFCGLSYGQICKIMNNITASCCARLTQKGFQVLSSSNIINELILEFG